MTKFEKHIGKLKLPEGFIGTMYQEGKEQYYSVNNVANDIKIEFHEGGRGKTDFKVDKGWLTFDRLGVEASFYHESLYKGDKPDPIQEIFDAQLKRIAERVEYYKTAIPIPGIPGGHTTSPDKAVNLRAQLKKTGHLMFSPPGFGTGYMISTKPSRRYGEKRAPAELEVFMKLNPLWITSVDMD